MRLKFLGTGTSQGVPPIGCTDPVCLSEDPKDRRLRTSALITTEENKKILIDCGPDFRQQMLSNNESRVDAVLITHEHNDHVIGLDDMRPIIFRNHQDMPLYCKARTGHEIKKRFPYAFADDKYPGAPAFEMHLINNSESFDLFDVQVTPVEVQHAKIDIFGYKFKNLAYLTDVKNISEIEKEKLKNLDFLIISCLRREKKHLAHLILPEVLELIKELQPTQTYLTHMSHHMGFHKELCKELPASIQPAYDGLEIEF